MADKPVLKWLFRVQFADGSTYNQTPNDKSVIDPKRSEYYDMMEAEKRGKKIRYFSLFEVGTTNIVSVDLGTGLFFVNKLPVLLESQKLPKLPEKFNLIFYHQVDQNQTMTIQKSTGKVLKTEQSTHREYFIGWECEIAGKKYIQKLAVS